MDSNKYDFIGSFAKAATTVSLAQYDWVARREANTAYILCKRI